MKRLVQSCRWPVAGTKEEVIPLLPHKEQTRRFVSLQKFVESGGMTFGENMVSGNTAGAISDLALDCFFFNKYLMLAVFSCVLLCLSQTSRLIFVGHFGICHPGSALLLSLELCCNKSPFPNSAFTLVEGVKCGSWLYRQWLDKEEKDLVTLRSQGGPTVLTGCCVQ